LALSNKNKYFIILRTWVYPIKEKSYALIIFQQFKVVVEKQSGYVLKTLPTDKGGEFTCNDFYDYCKKNGIYRQLTASYTPQQDGVV
jgi:hypothetical protein